MFEITKGVLCVLFAFLCHNFGFHDKPPTEASDTHKGFKTENEGGCPDENACADYCGSQGYALGECYDTYCSCMNLGTNSMKEVLKPEDGSGCPKDDACADYCKSQGLPAGYCVGEFKENCICMRTGTSNSNKEVLKPEDGSGCPKDDACADYCKTQGLPAGYCVGEFKENCICMRTGTDNNHKEVSKPEYGSGCPKDDSCADYCKSIGLPNGYCVGEFKENCICMRTEAKEDAEEKVCDEKKCKRKCLMERKSRVGKCNKKGNCMCY